MKLLRWDDLSAPERRAALERPAARTDVQLQAEVRSIVETVRGRGWDGLVELSLSLDKQEPREVAVADLARKVRGELPAEHLRALELAADRIRHFHEGSLPADFEMEAIPGVSVAKTWRPIDRVGIYVPGGRTPLFSSLMMIAIPARSAGVRQILAVTPPRPGGGLDPLLAVAAELSGLETIWTVGGAQAVAAMAFGAGAIGTVDKICGPGNVWVAEAKRLVASLPGGPAIDLPAGPSELMIIAGEGACVEFVALDLLSQAEHDPTAQVLLVTCSAALAGRVLRRTAELVRSLPRRKIAEAALDQGRAIVVSDLGQALDIANLYAPEHLSLALEDPERLIGDIRNAGAVFAGPFAAETFGDYLAGSSHVLPTDGGARAFGGISVHTFLKAMSVQVVTREGAGKIASAAALLARMEALEGHARAADARLELAA